MLSVLVSVVAEMVEVAVVAIADSADMSWAVAAAMRVAVLVCHSYLRVDVKVAVGRIAVNVQKVGYMVMEVDHGTLAVVVGVEAVVGEVA